MQRAVFFAVLVFMLSGCVTTMEKDVSKPNPEKALATHVKLGLGYIGEKNLDSARFHLNKAYELDSGDPGMLNGRGLLYQLEGEPELAEKHFKQALRKDPSFTQARLNYATFLFNHNRFQEAYDHYLKASEDLNYERRAVCLYGVGASAMKLGREERAVASFEHAVLLQPSLAAAHLELADIRLKEKKYAEAKRSLSQYERYAKASSRSLWIGIQIERVFGNKDKEASQALSLKNLFPYSKEYLEYKKSKESR